MNAQFKKGILEMMVLISLQKKDMYGYELVQKISNVFDVNEGTIYPLLRRLKNDKLVDTYLIESNEGPPRKYYRLTTLGIKETITLVKEFKQFNDSVVNFIKENENND